MDDLFQDLVLALLRRWPDYDADRSAPATFADRVARSAALNRLEAARAAKRGRHVPHITWDAVAERHGSQSDPVLRLDVHRQLATLDPASRQVCEALVLYPVAEAARVLGLSRGALRRRMARLRNAFERAGLRAHLEAA